MFQYLESLPLAVKIVVIIAAVAVYAYFIYIASRFCAFNNTPPSDPKDAMLAPYYPDTH
jgi:hypothetical protein